MKHTEDAEPEQYGAWHQRWSLPPHEQGARAHQEHMDELLARIRRLRASQAAMDKTIRRLKLEWLATFRVQRRYLKQAGLPAILRVLEDAAGGADDEAAIDALLGERAKYGADVAEGE